MQTLSAYFHAVIKHYFEPLAMQRAVLVKSFYTETSFQCVYLHCINLYNKIMSHYFKWLVWLKCQLSRFTNHHMVRIKLGQAKLVIRFLFPPAWFFAQIPQIFHYVEIYTAQIFKYLLILFIIVLLRFFALFSVKK